MFFIYLANFHLRFVFSQIVWYIRIKSTQIQLKFLPKTPATTKPETFRILYGTFQIDITERLLKVATVTPQGINVPEAKLPNGKHKLVLNVQDSDGRVGSRLIEFEIK